MVSTEVYVTIGLDKQGNVVEVRLKGGDPIRYRESPRGLLREGGSAPGCEEVLKTLVHELLTCKKKEGKGGTGTGGSGTGTGSGTGSGSDPCCYRDPATGRIWCWC
jgi:hypothetical protein